MHDKKVVMAKALLDSCERISFKNAKRNSNNIILGSPRKITKESKRFKCAFCKKYFVWVSGANIDLLKAGGRACCPACILKVIEDNDFSLAMVNSDYDKSEKFLKDKLRDLRVKNVGKL